MVAVEISSHTRCFSCGCFLFKIKSFVHLLLSRCFSVVLLKELLKLKYKILHFVRVLMTSSSSSSSLVCYLQTCELCPLTGGCMKETTQNQWMHVVCARYKKFFVVVCSKVAAQVVLTFFWLVNYTAKKLISEQNFRLMFI